MASSLLGEKNLLHKRLFKALLSSRNVFEEHSEGCGIMLLPSRGKIEFQSFAWGKLLTFVFSIKAV